MNIAIGSDHGGFAVKEQVKVLLQERGVDVEDLGCVSGESVDYTDFGQKVALRVVDGQADRGVLVCTTGLGMVMTANRFPGVRAALCMSPEMAEKSRSHNDANVLVLAGGLIDGDAARRITTTWLETEFLAGERHTRRISKIEDLTRRYADIAAVSAADPEAYATIRGHMAQEQTTINLIASENTVSSAVRQAQGCVMTNKYAEGYPAKRWYNGCEFVDEAEVLAIDRAKSLFGAEHANVQPHCGSAANMAVYFAALELGDTILAMRLDQGGHLTHGSSVNFSGRLFNIASYGVSRETEQIDYDALAALADECRPKMIVAGASAYPRTLDFERFRAIADSVGAMLMVDMAHIAGLIAGDVHPSPVPYADFVTTTTHKTLRGPRSGMVLCRQQYAASLDKTVFPGLQGGPQMHSTVAKAVCFHEAMQPAFKGYARQIVANATAMSEALGAHGFTLVSGGTDNHLMLVNLAVREQTGKVAAIALDRAGIICNKNTIPFDLKSPFVTSGIRLGTPAVTTRGMKEPEMQLIADAIAEVLNDVDNADLQSRVRDRMVELTRAFPIP